MLSTNFLRCRVQKKSREILLFRRKFFPLSCDFINETIFFSDIPARKRVAGFLAALMHYYWTPSVEGSGTVMEPQLQPMNGLFVIAPRIS